MNAQLTKKDWQSDNEVRWCPGCGDYAILATVQKTLAELGLSRENTVFVSGIGCAARFPYYMNAYGLHTIHGRGPAFASGLKLSNKALEVFLVTGDGDGLSIGANHLLHLFRRNINIKVLLFNNQIYGLTKGQYSPTSNKGHKAKSTPFGSLEEPVNPIAFALSAKASFVARSIDTDAQHLAQVLKAAILHKGASFIEILQTCVVFNDNAFDHVREKANRDSHVLSLKESEPWLFDNGQKGIAVDPIKLLPHIVSSGLLKETVIHELNSQGFKAEILASLKGPEFPVPIGIFRALERPTYESEQSAQDQSIFSGNKDLKSLLLGGASFEV
ncbi:MAG TPA: 2-oxoacid:ferredoxin oxidoreductase subunit beta [Myxococcota bacterium]|nr:2-oxoacid:ferredoxin oxidoreductase subunit beta [Myxococcota bacterium]